MAWWQLYIILGVIAVAIIVGYFFFRRSMKKKMNTQQQMVDQHKVTTTILVLEKKKEKVTNANLPKSVIEQIPKIYRIRKIPIVKAKIGPQVMDLLCDDAVYDKLPEKKTVQVELAGIYIAGIKKPKK